MTQTKKAPKYFIEIITYSNKLAEKMFNNMGLSLNWFDQSKGNAFQERLDKIDKTEQIKIKSYLEFRATSYKYAWARFRIKNIDNEWGKAELLDYDPDKEIIILQAGITKVFKKIKFKVKNKYKDIKSIINQK